VLAGASLSDLLPALLILVVLVRVVVVVSLLVVVIVVVLVIVVICPPRLLIELDCNFMWSLRLDTCMPIMQSSINVTYRGVY
jgi:hypothetical protein